MESAQATCERDGESDWRSGSKKRLDDGLSKPTEKRQVFSELSNTPDAHQKRKKRTTEDAVLSVFDEGDGGALDDEDNDKDAAFQIATPEDFGKQPRRSSGVTPTSLSGSSGVLDGSQHSQKQTMSQDQTEAPSEAEERSEARGTRGRDPQLETSTPHVTHQKPQELERESRRKTISPTSLRLTENKLQREWNVAMIQADREQDARWLQEMQCRQEQQEENQLDTSALAFFEKPASSLETQPVAVETPPQTLEPTSLQPTTPVVAASTSPVVAATPSPSPILNRNYTAHELELIQSYTRDVVGSTKKTLKEQREKAKATGQQHAAASLLEMSTELGFESFVSDRLAPGEETKESHLIAHDQPQEAEIADVDMEQEREEHDASLDLANSFFTSDLVSGNSTTAAQQVTADSEQEHSGFPVDSSKQNPKEMRAQPNPKSPKKDRRSLDTEEVELYKQRLMALQNKYDSSSGSTQESLHDSQHDEAAPLSASGTVPSPKQKPHARSTAQHQEKASEKREEHEASVDFANSFFSSDLLSGHTLAAAQESVVESEQDDSDVVMRSQEHADTNGSDDDVVVSEDEDEPQDQQEQIPTQSTRNQQDKDLENVHGTRDVEMKERLDREERGALTNEMEVEIDSSSLEKAGDRLAQEPTGPLANEAPTNDDENMETSNTSESVSNPDQASLPDVEMEVTIDYSKAVNQPEEIPRMISPQEESMTAASEQQDDESALDSGSASKDTQVDQSDARKECAETEKSTTQEPVETFESLISRLEKARSTNPVDPQADRQQASGEKISRVATKDTLAEEPLLRESTAQENNEIEASEVQNFPSESLMSPPPTNQRIKVPLKGILSAKKQGKRAPTPAKSVNFGPSRGAEFRLGSPSTSMTPLNDREAHRMFPLDRPSPPTIYEEEEDEETALNTSILQQADARGGSDEDEDTEQDEQEGQQEQSQQNLRSGGVAFERQRVSDKERQRVHREEETKEEQTVSSSVTMRTQQSDTLLTQEKAQERSSTISARKLSRNSILNQLTPSHMAIEARRRRRSSVLGSQSMGTTTVASASRELQPPSAAIQNVTTLTRRDSLLQQLERKPYADSSDEGEDMEITGEYSLLVERQTAAYNNESVSTTNMEMDRDRTVEIVGGLGDLLRADEQDEAYKASLRSPSMSSDDGEMISPPKIQRLGDFLEEESPGAKKKKTRVASASSSLECNEFSMEPRLNAFEGLDEQERVLDPIVEADEDSRTRNSFSPANASAMSLVESSEEEDEADAAYQERRKHLVVNLSEKFARINSSAIESNSKIAKRKSSGSCDNSSRKSSAKKRRQSGSFGGSLQFAEDSSESMVLAQSDDEEEEKQEASALSPHSDQENPSSPMDLDNLQEQENPSEDVASVPPPVSAAELFGKLQITDMDRADSSKSHLVVPDDSLDNEQCKMEALLQQSVAQLVEDATATITSWSTALDQELAQLDAQPSVCNLDLSSEETMDLLKQLYQLEMEVVAGDFDEWRHELEQHLVQKLQKTHEHLQQDVNALTTHAEAMLMSKQSDLEVVQELLEKEQRMSELLSAVEEQANFESESAQQVQTIESQVTSLQLERQVVDHQLNEISKAKVQQQQQVITEERIVQEEQKISQLEAKLTLMDQLTYWKWVSAEASRLVLQMRFDELCFDCCVTVQLDLADHSSSSDAAPMWKVHVQETLQRRSKWLFVDESDQEKDAVVQVARSLLSTSRLQQVISSSQQLKSKSNCVDGAEGEEEDALVGLSYQLRALEILLIDTFDLLRALRELSFVYPLTFDATSQRVWIRFMIFEVQSVFQVGFELGRTKSSPSKLGLTAPVVEWEDQLYNATTSTKESVIAWIEKQTGSNALEDRQLAPWCEQLYTQFAGIPTQ